MNKSNQLDLFVALAGDVPFRDEREAMSAPLVSLSKRKRTLIEWQGPSGQTVTVSAAEKYGIATIWDYDVILWAVSQINQAVDAGLETSPRIFFHPYDALKATGRDTGGKGYKELKAALDRLRATGVAYESPALKGKRRKKGAFNLLSACEFEDTAEGKAKGAWLELPLWLYQAVTQDRDVLAISPRYFELSSGLDRFLYRLARRHVGKQAGWAFTFRDIHTRSGSSQSYGDFARDLRKAITRNALPEYGLAEVEGANGPTLSMYRDATKSDFRDRRFNLPKPRACG
jgi:plasmid replication initiation protein